MNSFLRVLPGLVFALWAFSLMSCGDDLTTQNVSQSELAMGEVSNATLLPICGAESEGAVVLVTSDMLTRVCVDGIWKISVAGAEIRYTCSAENLPDGGAKIVCNGDSVGVVHNGTEGDDGLDGADCEVYQTADSLQIVVTCGMVKTAIYLGYTSSSKKESSSSVVSSSSEIYSSSELYSSSEENISSEQSSSISSPKIVLALSLARLAIPVAFRKASVWPGMSSSGMTVTPRLRANSRTSLNSDCV